VYPPGGSRCWCSDDREELQPLQTHRRVQIVDLKTSFFFISVISVKVGS
jgi:hypothetical protein